MQPFDERRDDCKNALDKARCALFFTPQYVDRLEVGMKVSTNELLIVQNSNMRIPQKGGDAEVDERKKLILTHAEIKKSQLQLQAHKGGIGDEGRARSVWLSQN
ncbi:hypothetical protein L917_05956 [Phytophthora nicotianae]|uniref:Uncharacterized protein n=1 Tax=Phytophthora nicotianae TaxID=4792 RepID=W2LGM1_PHYNI|nr:hypothetical protein L917_05956 [Phytophthora nicotianae]